MHCATGFFTVTDVQKMMEEIVIMQQFNHRNVIRLLGVVVEGLSGPSIVMPFMANGNLSSFLRKNRDTTLLPPSADPETVVDSTDQLCVIWELVLATQVGLDTHGQGRSTWLQSICWDVQL